MSRKTIAVLSDTTSSDFMFPIWYKYYSTLFGPSNLFVVAFPGVPQNFLPYELGGLIKVDEIFNEDLRLKIITPIIHSLLMRYDVVIRIDIDEMLVVDPARFGNLREYIHQWGGEYITARGFDLMQWQDETSLELTSKILNQRKWGYALSAMNKTCMTRVPLQWGRGFHYCTAMPAFGDVFLFHLKRIDAGLERAWCHRMLEVAKNDVHLQEYYTQELGFIESFGRHRWSLPADEGPDVLMRNDYLVEFNSKIRLNPGNGVFDGPYDQENRNIRIPDRFQDIF